MRSLIALTLIFAVGFSLSSVFAQVQFQDFHQGIAPSDGRGTTSQLNWVITYQDGTETGNTDITIANLIADTSLPALTFSPQDDPLRTLLRAEVFGSTNHLNIGQKFCFQEPNWNFDQMYIINGFEFDVPRTFADTKSFDQATQVSTSSGVKFSTNLAETLVNFQGITLKNGDEFIWKVVANNRATIVEGFVQGELIETGTNQFFDTQFGKCTVTGQGYDAYATGMVFELKMIYNDPSVELTAFSSQPDTDGDGIPDSIDECSFEAENYNGFEDSDGCADTIPVPVGVVVQVNEIPVINQLGEVEIIMNLDFDNDGIPNDIDRCPNDAEIFNGFEDEDGCPFEDPVPMVQFLQPNPMTNFHVDTFEEPVSTLEGTTQECNPLVSNCNEVIAEAIRTVETFTGIKLPFEPSILNLMLVIGGIGVVVLIIAQLTGKLKKI